MTAMRGAAILVVCVLCAGCGQVADAQARLVDNLRIKGAVAEYEKATRPLDRCVKAKLVAAAYADARDLTEAGAWTAREHEDCQSAAAAMHVSLPAAKP
jgi:hypothetical protein